MSKYRVVVALRHQPTILVGVWDEMNDAECARFALQFRGMKEKIGITLYEDEDTPVFIHADDISYVRLEKHK